jgi:S-layer protein (TIGR01567 family)
MENVKPPVKEAVKQFTKDYVSEVVKESTKKLIKGLEKEKKTVLEAELKNRSAEEIERYFDTNAEFKDAFESTVDSIKEASLKKIQTSFEESFSKYLTPYHPTLFERVAHWIKSPLHAGIISVIMVAVVVALIYSNASPEIPSMPIGPASGDIITTYSYSTSSTDKNGDNIKYLFDWGDGTTTETDYYSSGSTASALHSWSSPGTYNIKAMAIDSKDAASGWSNSFSVNIAPNHTAVALTAIANGLYSGTVNGTIFFAGSASGGTPPYTYSWNFGDSASSSQQNATHAYSGAGNYTANLTVTDSAGITAQDSARVTVGSKLVAMANGPYSGTIGIQITFAGSASGGTPPYAYSWNFGDGASSSQQNPTHAYGVGTYTANLTVTDSAGTTAQDSAQVTVASGKTATWDIYNFAGFYYDLDGNLGNESLQILQTNLAANQRTIDTGNLIYTTMGQPKVLYAVLNGKASDASGSCSSTGSCTFNGLQQFDAGQMSSVGGAYNVVGWQAQQYVGIKNLSNKLAKLIIEQGTSSSDKKTLTVGEVWDIGGGWTLTAQSIDAKASPRQARLVLNKDGVMKDDKIVYQGQVYTYTEKSIAGESDVPLFVTYVDSVFAGPTSDMVQLRYTWAINNSITEVKVGDTYGVFKVVAIDTAGGSLVLRNTDTTISLSRDTTVNLLGNLSFRVADSDVLRFMPVVVTVFTQPGAYETRGTIWSEFPIAGSIGGTGKTETWDAYNFAGFYYDLDDNLGSESLQILQTNLAANQRTIDTSNLIYTTMGQPKALKVLENGKTDSSNTNGLDNFDTMSSVFGNYLVVGWQAQQYVGIKNLPNKLAQLIIEQQNATSDKKTLTVQDTWDIGGGWTLQAQSIDAKASPRQAWLVLSKDGVKKDDKIVYQGQVYTYTENSIGGESDVPVFVTYVDSVFAGTTSDMVQLRYTWAIGTSITEIKGGDTYGVFKVQSIGGPGQPIILMNDNSSVILSRDATVNLMGEMDFRVADSDVLRFMPVVEFTQPGTYETRGAVWNEFPIAGLV